MIHTRHSIRRWMSANIADHVDECNEVNATALVEAWDRECADGSATLDMDHVAWEVASQLAGAYDSQKE